MSKPSEWRFSLQMWSRMRTLCTTSCSLKKSLSEHHIPCSFCALQMLPSLCKCVKTEYRSAKSASKVHSRICKGQLTSSDCASSILLSRACAFLGMLDTAPPALRALAAMLAADSAYSNAASVSRSSSGIWQHMTMHTCLGIAVHPVNAGPGTFWLRSAARRGAA